MDVLHKTPLSMESLFNFKKLLIYIYFNVWNYYGKFCHFSISSDKFQLWDTISSALLLFFPPVVNKVFCHALNSHSPSPPSIRLLHPLEANLFSICRTCAARKLSINSKIDCDAQAALTIFQCITSEAQATANSCWWPAGTEQWRLCWREQIRACSRELELDRDRGFQGGGIKFLI